MTLNKYFKLFIQIVLLSFVLYFLYLYIPKIFNNKIEYSIYNKTVDEIDIENTKDLDIKEKINEEEIVLLDEVQKNEIIPEIIISHINTPENVKAIYMSSWVASGTSLRDKLIDLVDKTELNSIVVDIKDSTGKISFEIDHPLIKKENSSENRIRDIKKFTKLLHDKNIYIIGRISVFQDPYLAVKNPKMAIKKLSDGTVWKDRKGLSFLDPTNKEVHDYIIAIAKESYNLGFDEINFDYIRYPSDGNMKDINYNLIGGNKREDNIEYFFKTLHTEMKKEIDIPISADLFGLTTEVNNDMGIGQIWEKALPYFDFISPMVYPSHYPSGYLGYKNPSQYPYEVINKSLSEAVKKTNIANDDIGKIRPWLQDFDLGATYTKEMVKAQIKASYDNKINSWMLWDPSNKYTPEALVVENN